MPNNNWGEILAPTKNKWDEILAPVKNDWGTILTDGPAPEPVKSEVKPPEPIADVAPVTGFVAEQAKFNRARRGYGGRALVPATAPILSPAEKLERAQMDKSSAEFTAREANAKIVADAQVKKDYESQSGLEKNWFFRTGHRFKENMQSAIMGSALTLGTELGIPGAKEERDRQARLSGREQATQEYADTQSGTLGGAASKATAGILELGATGGAGRAGRAVSMASLARQPYVQFMAANTMQRQLTAADADGRTGANKWGAAAAHTMVDVGAYYAGQKVLGTPFQKLAAGGEAVEGTLTDHAVKWAANKFDLGPAMSNVLKGGVGATSQGALGAATVAGHYMAEVGTTDKVFNRDELMAQMKAQLPTDLISGGLSHFITDVADTMAKRINALPDVAAGIDAAREWVKTATPAQLAVVKKNIANRVFGNATGHKNTSQVFREAFRDTLNQPTDNSALVAPNGEPGAVPGVNTSGPVDPAAILQNGETPGMPQQATPTGPGASPVLPEVGQTIEFQSGFPARPIRGEVVRIQIDPVTGDGVPIIKSAGGREFPAAEWYDTGRVIETNAAVGTASENGSVAATRPPTAPDLPYGMTLDEFRNRVEVRGSEIKIDGEPIYKGKGLVTPAVVERVYRQKADALAPLPETPAPEIDKDTAAVLRHTAEQHLQENPELQGGAGAEFPPAADVDAPPPEPTSMRKADTNDLRASLGLPEATSDGRTWDEALSNAKAKGIPERAQEIANETIAKPKAWNDEETAGMAVALHQLKTRHAELRAALPRDEAGRHENAVEQNRVQDEIDTITLANAQSYGEKGRALNAQKLLVDDALDLASVTARAAVAKGESLTPEQRAEFEPLVEKAAAADKAVADLGDDTPTMLGDVLEDIGGFYSSKAKRTKPAGAEPEDIDPVDEFAAGLKAVANSARAKQPKTPGPTVFEKIGALREQLDTLDVDDAMHAQAKSALDKLERHFTDLKWNPRAKAQEPKASPLAKALEDIGAFHTTETKTPQQRTAVDEVAAKLRGLAASARAKPTGEPETKQTPLERAEALRHDIDALDVPDADKASAHAAVDKLAGHFKRKETGLDVDYLTFEQWKARRDIANKIDSMRPKSVWEYARMPIDAARSLVTSYDFSALLRQGSFFAVAHPKLTIRAFPEAWEAMKDTTGRAEYEANQKLWHRANAWLYKKSGLFLHAKDGKPGGREEGWLSQAVEKLPGVGASQRGYTTLLNRMRADYFDTLVATLGKKGEVTAPEAHALAHFVNVTTGRGETEVFDSALTGLGAVMFAPRYTLSRFQLLTGGLTGGYSYGGGKRVRQAIQQEYARYVLGMGAVYAMAAYGLGDQDGFSITFDPRSPDFGKIRLGRTRIDPLAGLSQATRFLVQTIGGQRVNEFGRTVDVAGDYAEPRQGSTDQTVWRFLQSKASPFVGTAMDLARRENFQGEKVGVTSGEGLWNLAKGTLMPMSWRDLKTTLEDQGAPQGTAIQLANLAGVGVQTYGKKYTPDEFFAAQSNDYHNGIAAMEQKISAAFKDKEQNDPAKLAETYAKYDTRRRQLVTEWRGLVTGAKERGISDDSIRKSLVDAGGRNFAAMVLDKEGDKYMPYMPGRESLKEIVAQPKGREKLNQLRALYNNNKGE